MSDIDAVDKEILRLLGINARESASTMAGKLQADGKLKISASAVRRRIARLEDEGFITKYTVVVDHERVGRSVEAYVELTFEGDADVQAVLRDAIKMPAVREVSTLAGDPDAIVRVRVDHPAHLRNVVTKLRNLDGVTGSKTLVALGRLRHLAEYPEE